MHNERTYNIQTLQYTNFIPLSYIEHVKHEAYVQKRKYLCSVMAAIEKNNNTHTLSHTHSDPMQWVLLLRVTNATKFVI